MANILTFEQILATDDRQTVTVPVPEWGGDVVVRSLTRAEHRKAVNAATDKEGKADSAKLERLLVGLALVEPKITALQYDQLAQTKSSGALQRIVDAIVKLSGSGEDAVAEAEAEFPDES